MVSRRVLLAALAFVATVAVSVSAGPIECYTDCAATYAQCTKQCATGDVACYTQCSSTYQSQCLPKCTQADTAAASVNRLAASTPVGDSCEATCGATYASCGSRCVTEPASCRAQCDTDYSWCRWRCPHIAIAAEAEAEAAVSVVAADPTPVECYAGCAGEYSTCTKQCAAGDVACYTQCSSTYQSQCLPKCTQSSVEAEAEPVTGARECYTDCINLENCRLACRENVAARQAKCSAADTMPNPVETSAQCRTRVWMENATCEDSCKQHFPNLAVEAEPVTGARECIKECKSKGKAATDKCKHEKFAKRAACYARVPATVKACESGCARKPHAWATLA